MSKKKSSYAAAGVDIDEMMSGLTAIKKMVKSTNTDGVRSSIGSFGGLFKSPGKGNTIVASADGVGTKLKVAIMADRHNTVGQDLINHCTNDILVQGATPLFFLDYLGTAKLAGNVFKEVVSGLCKACKENGCALLGGETAEMPGMYKNNEYDLAGFAVGLVDNSKIVDGSGIGAGHKLIGLASSGLHSNGYSLVRKLCFEILNMKIDTYVPELGKIIGEELITPTKIYSEIIHSFIKDLPIHGLAHITGGGLAENVVRVLPDTCQAVVQTDSWDVPPIFHFIQDAGKISDREMRRTFNNGIGLVGIVPDNTAQEILERLNAMSEKAFLIVERKEGDDKIIWV